MTSPVRETLWCILLCGILAGGQVVGAASVQAAPVPEAERVDIDLRRTTLVVRDIDQSLAFYRDALGLKVIYDREIFTPRDAKNIAAAESALRLVFLQANDDYIGVIGLLQYAKPAKQSAHQGAEPFSVGSIVLVFNTDNLESRFQAARNTLGVKVLDEPSETQYPDYQGKGMIKVKVSVLIDPDGYVVELNQLLSELK